MVTLIQPNFPTNSYKLPIVYPKILVEYLMEKNFLSIIDYL